MSEFERTDCEGNKVCEFLFDYFIYFDWATLALLGIATFIIIIGSIIHMSNNKENAIKTLYMFGGVSIILLCSYFILASDNVNATWEILDPIPNKETSQLVGMGLWSFYILLSIAAVSVIITELSQRFSK